MVRTFLWRVCNNSLPTKENLFHLKITFDPLCLLCGQCLESKVHILWDCESAIVVWMECSKKIQKLSIVASEDLGLFIKLMELLDDEEFAAVIFLVWSIWV